LPLTYVDDVMNLTLSLERAARIHRRKLATICGDRRHDYATLRDRVTRLAGAPKRGGFRAGLDPNRAALMDHSMSSSDHLMLI